MTAPDMACSLRSRASKRSERASKLGRVDFRVFVEPQQGASYADQLAIAKAAESLGYSAFFRSDHYVAMSGDGLPGPTDSWVTLAGLARETQRIRLGTMVTSATFRYPGPLAISVAQVDEMSGGRVDLGIGAGWFEKEHHAYAIPFPPLGERFDRLEEQLDILTGLWSTPPGSTFDYRGAHYSITESPALPKPVQQPGPPIIIGGKGKKRTPELAAKFAAEFNVPFDSLDVVKSQYQRVSAAVEAAGRAADSMTYSACFVVCAGRDDAEIARRAAAIGREVDELRTNTPLVGTPGEIVDKLGAFTEAGVQRVYLQVLDLADLDHLELFAEGVVAQWDNKD
ncbi:LLM class F420-dependent oxidoreductase [soil metagenome]